MAIPKEEMPTLVHLGRKFMDGCNPMNELGFYRILGENMTLDKKSYVPKEHSVPPRKISFIFR
jgi:hypothetical protein